MTPAVIFSLYIPKSFLFVEQERVKTRFRKAPWKEPLFVASVRRRAVLLRMSVSHAGAACSSRASPKLSGGE